MEAFFSSYKGEKLMRRFPLDNLLSPTRRCGEMPDRTGSCAECSFGPTVLWKHEDGSPLKFLQWNCKFWMWLQPFVLIRFKTGKLISLIPPAILISPSNHKLYSPNTDSHELSSLLLDSHTDPTQTVFGSLVQPLTALVADNIQALSQPLPVSS